MKKTIQLLFLLFIVLGFTVVNAAYAYVWTVNGEHLTRGGDAVFNGSAKWIESEEYSGGILVLDNYNGGEIKVECKGTGMNQVFAVELKGDNVINSENIGFLTTDKVVFIGDGTLSITAPVPVSSVDEIEVPKVKSNITLYGKDNTIEEATTQVKEEVKEESKDEDKTKEVAAKDDEEVVVDSSKGINKYLYLLIIGVTVCCLFALAFVISKINKKRS